MLFLKKKSLALVLQTKSANFTLPRARRTLTQVCRFVVYLGLLYKQQPFWGVGRLRLSVIGFAEPRLDKCNDSRLFCIHTESAQFIAVFAGAGTP